MDNEGNKYVVAMDFDAIIAIEELQRQVEEIENLNNEKKPC